MKNKYTEFRLFKVIENNVIKKVKCNNAYFEKYLTVKDYSF